MLTLDSSTKIHDTNDDDDDEKSVRTKQYNNNTSSSSSCYNTSLDYCKKCCINGKCTMNQLLKICHEDPDSIIDIFKIAKAEEKCLPEIELDIKEDNDTDDKTDEAQDINNKYHFLMVDHSTSLHPLQQTDSKAKKEVSNDNSKEIVKNLATKTPKPSIRITIGCSDEKVTHPEEIQTAAPKEKKIKTALKHPNNSSLENSLSTTEERERSKSIVWSESNRGSSDEFSTRLLHLENWQSPLNTPAICLSENTGFSRLSLVLKQEKYFYSDEIFVGETDIEVKETKNKFWPRCFECFKRKNRGRSTMKLPALLEVAKKDDDSIS